MTPNHLDGDRKQAKGGFLVWLSGADRTTLAECPPAERAKFLGVGGVVLTTATMAAVSSIFTLTIGVKAPLWAAIPIGVLWGLAIMNLDRWLVAATPRRKRWFQNLYIALPRIMLAVIIGAVISTPMVLWIFNREITSELEVIKQERATAFQQDLNSDERFKGIPALEAEVKNLQGVVNGTVTPQVPEDSQVTQLRQRHAEVEKQYQAARTAATCEHDGTCGTGVPGAGSDYYLKVKIAEDLRRQLDEVAAQLEAVVTQSKAARDAAIRKARESSAQDLATRSADLASRTADKSKAETEYQEANANSGGLLAQLEALSRLTGSNATLKGAYLALLLFIAAIEILPVLVKFFINLGPETVYEQLHRGKEQLRLDEADMRHRQEREHLAKVLAERAEMDNEVRARSLTRERDLLLRQASREPVNLYPAPQDEIPWWRRPFGRTQSTARDDRWPAPEIDSDDDSDGQRFQYERF